MENLKQKNIYIYIITVNSKNNDMNNSKCKNKDVASANSKHKEAVQTVTQNVLRKNILQ